jgi:hypothetical protein
MAAARLPCPAKSRRRSGLRSTIDREEQGRRSTIVDARVALAQFRVLLRLRIDLGHRGGRSRPRTLGELDDRDVRPHVAAGQKARADHEDAPHHDASRKLDHSGPPSRIHLVRPGRTADARILLASPSRLSVKRSTSDSSFRSHILLSVGLTSPETYVGHDPPAESAAERSRLYRESSKLTWRTHPRTVPDCKHSPTCNLNSFGKIVKPSGDEELTQGLVCRIGRATGRTRTERQKMEATPEGWRCPNLYFNRWLRRLLVAGTCFAMCWRYSPTSGMVGWFEMQNC